MKISRVTRVVKILTALQAEEKCTVDDLAKMFNTSRRTVFRDLKELQAIGVPYRFDSANQGYTVDPEFFLPPIDLNLQEAFSLLLLVHKAGKKLQLPFRNSALLAGLKIENNLPTKIRQHCSISLRNISTKITPQAPMSQLDRVFATIQKAIVKKQKLTLCYKSLFESQIITTELCPYHLLYNKRAWYVLGYSAMHKAIRTFKLNRIIEITKLDKLFIDTRGFDIDEHFGRAWSMIPEGRLYNIKLRFLPKVAHNVTEVLWHDTQQHQFQDDGSVIMEFRIDGVNEISWWILSYGDQVQVLSPKVLREKIVRIAKNMIKFNEEI